MIFAVVSKLGQMKNETMLIIILMIIKGYFINKVSIFLMSDATSEKLFLRPLVECSQKNLKQLNFQTAIMSFGHCAPALMCTLSLAPTVHITSTTYLLTGCMQVVFLLSVKMGNYCQSICRYPKLILERSKTQIENFALP